MKKILVWLLIVWLVLVLLGFAVKGLFWLGIIGIVLFVVTGVFGWVQRKAVSK